MKTSCNNKPQTEWNEKEKKRQTLLKKVLNISVLRNTVESNNGEIQEHYEVGAFEE